ncbi:TPA: hypothetical protein IU311_001783 [Enterococcus faecalis]|uniref:Uncharacterized protein n=1 Tax=Enterococcus faecalis TaxID=1351 RepID=A0A6B1Y323_ENTFL|nr:MULTISPECIES: hypothetical protein [Enterococcus]EKX6153141.1 hypothetical protein [Pseudomonas aeruginosa]CPW57062.1 Uncharacterised protein [Mycobacteroides abscessus]EGO2709819.1 hypothetical protein [Enterococcus faecalis]EOD87818.1 hypothetical protein Q93_01142 [Enterococcus faecalis EnGen0065]EOE38681.1 hypothetical protein QAM_01711 [Enterococcus faecalis EnGen0070]
MSELRHQEIIDRVHYMYLQTDGTIEFPNSFEGDLLKIAYGTAVQSIKQPQLNPNQQIVLDWLKEKYTVTNIEPIELFWRLRVNSIKPDYRGRPVYRSYRYMSKIGQLQVIQAFSRWALEQEKAE